MSGPDRNFYCTRSQSNTFELFWELGRRGLRIKPLTWIATRSLGPGGLPSPPRRSTPLIHRRPDMAGNCHGIPRPSAANALRVACTVLPDSHSELKFLVGAEVVTRGIRNHTWGPPIRAIKSALSRISTSRPQTFLRATFPMCRASTPETGPDSAAQAERRESPGRGSFAACLVRSRSDRIHLADHPPK
jgi:hypothetical protein